MLAHRAWRRGKSWGVALVCACVPLLAQPAWDDAGRVAQLVAAVEAVRAHGLDPADFDRVWLRAQSGVDARALTPDQRALRSQRLERIVAELVRQLQGGRVDPRTLHPHWNFTAAPDDSAYQRLLDAVLAAPDLAAAVAAQAPDHPDYLALQREFEHQRALVALGEAGPARRDTLRVNLERLRWVARDLRADHLRVDIASQRATLWLDGAPVWRARVVVGRSTRKTPQLRDAVQALVFNPHWVVPPTILRQDVLPAVVRDPCYLDRHRLHVVDARGNPVDPTALDWRQLRQGSFPYRIVQEAGQEGALGQIKFVLSNPYSIYLHDTNSPALFQRATRTFSSGCVRVEKPRELALWLLADPATWNEATLAAALDSGQTRTVAVQRALPVLLLYRTATVDEAGAVVWHKDIYAYDAAILAALERPLESAGR